MLMRRLLPVIGAALVAAALLVRPLPAAAHVKWFNDQYCVSCPPDALDRIFDRWWLASLAFFSLLSLCAFVIDRLWGEQAAAWFEGFVAQIQSPLEDYLRLGLGVFLLCLWVHGGILLTPELRTDNEAIAWLQLALAVCTLSWRTTWITAAGIFTLYGIALAQYGVFHLLDYPIFPGIAAYLAIHSLRPSDRDRIVTGPSRFQPARPEVLRSDDVGVGAGIPKNRCRTTVAEPIGGNASGTVPYRRSGQSV